MTPSMALTLYHNPRCSKSREALALLEARDIPHRVVRYLETGLTAEEARALLTKLGGAPADALRKKEAPYGEFGLKPGADLETVVAALVAHPVLLERPLLASDDAAAIGRPLENLFPLLER